MKPKYYLHPIIVIVIVIFLCFGNWYYNNAFVLLKPVLAKKTGDPVIVPYTNEMIENFPYVLKEYGVEYKMNDSGHFLIRAKYMHNVDYILTFTNCAVDSSLIGPIKRRQAQAVSTTIGR